MKAAVVNSFSAPPRFGAFADPEPTEDETLVTVTAAALSPLVRGQASGEHYSSAAVFPFIPGVDGVGTLPDGTRVYFAFPKSPCGSMAERVAIVKTLCVAIPDAVDYVTAAAIANPGMSSWAGLTERAHFEPGESVLINGATGVAGRLAIQIAKYLGAKTVIATGRDQAALEPLPALGADVVIALDQPADELSAAFRRELQANSINVVLDYLWGPSAECLHYAIAGDGAPEGAPRIRYVQLGSIAGPKISLPAATLRSSGLELMGSGLGSVSHTRLVAGIGALIRAVVPGGFRIATESVPLSDVESAWNRDTGCNRLVFTCRV